MAVYINKKHLGPVQVTRRVQVDVPGKHFPTLQSAEQAALYKGTAVEFSEKHASANSAATAPRHTGALRVEFGHQPGRLQTLVTSRTKDLLRTLERFWSHVGTLGRTLEDGTLVRTLERSVAHWNARSRVGTLSRTAWLCTLECLLVHVATLNHEIRHFHVINCLSALPHSFLR